MTQPSEPGIKSEYGEGDMEACDTNTTCLLVRRSARSRAAVTVLTLLFSVVFRLVATRVRMAPTSTSFPAYMVETWPPSSPSFPRSPCGYKGNCRSSFVQAGASSARGMSFEVHCRLSRAARRFCIDRRPRDTSWFTCCRGNSSAGMGSRYGHVSFRSNMGRAGRRERHHHQERERCRTGARGRPDDERDKFFKIRRSLTDAERRSASPPSAKSQGCSGLQHRHTP
jgi:hypothetical protein